METIETEGRTVAEAVETALRKSGLRRDQVEVTVTQEGSAGFMGLGAKPARVRLTEKRWGPDSPAGLPPAPRRAPAPSRAPEPSVHPPRTPRVREENASSPRPLSPASNAEACANAQKLVLELLRLMSVASPTATTVWDADLERVKIAIESQDASLLVGRDGRVLESLQFLATLMLSRGNGAPIAVQVDALSYWEKKEQAVLDAARRAVETVKATGKPVRMEPMDSSMRRLVHRTLGSNPDVTTSSEGEGSWRKLVIRSRKG